jgi:hypothetical protein
MKVYIESIAPPGPLPTSSEPPGPLILRRPISPLKHKNVWLRARPDHPPPPK